MLSPFGIWIAVFVPTNCSWSVSASRCLLLGGHYYSFTTVNVTIAGFISMERWPTLSKP
ncbi:MAG: hypothetical protein MK289_23905 [Trichodesmium sp. ALOHA_ZT_67]|nr:hypothetical protein [Trichodesmium sp. ALOHA_ZT_67]MDT9341769.1 hypothetical protein [Trichodesmium erythraeum 21-75]